MAAAVVVLSPALASAHPVSRVERAEGRDQTDLVEAPVLEETRLFPKLGKDRQYFAPGVPEQFLGIPRIRDRLLFLRVHQANMAEGPTHGISAESASHQMETTYPFGISLTNIQRSLKIPFHLSCAHTVEVWL